MSFSFPFSPLLLREEVLSGDPLWARYYGERDREWRKLGFVEEAPSLCG